MGNASLEDTERERGESSISTVLGQLIEALEFVTNKAEEEKASVDAARINAEVGSKVEEERSSEGAGRSGKCYTRNCRGSPFGVSLFCSTSTTICRRFYNSATSTGYYNIVLPGNPTYTHTVFF